MKRRVVITGLGAVTPLGNDIGSNWSAAIAGKCGIAAIRGFEGEDLPISVAGQVKGFDPLAAGLSAADVRHYDIYCQYAVAAALEAMADSGLVSGENIAADRLGVYIGSGIGGLQTFVNQTKVYMEGGARRVSPLFIPMMIGNMASGNCAIRFDARGVNLSTVAACASSTNSVGEAYIAVRDGRADAIISGGAEAAIHPLSIGGFANSRALSTAEDPLMACLPFDARRKGFVMAEGAGVLVLEEYEHARARGARIIAEVCGYGNSCDAYHYTAPRPDGSTTAAAIREALEEGGASSTKSRTGHMLGAAGAVELIFSALALRDGVVPPTIGLREADPECCLDYTPLKAKKRELDIAVSNSLGFGGHNASVCLRKFKE